LDGHRVDATRLGAGAFDIEAVASELAQEASAICERAELCVQTKSTRRLDT